MNTRLHLIMAVLFCSILIYGCSAAETIDSDILESPELSFTETTRHPQPEYIKISSEEARRMEPLYLDVRTQDEYYNGHIPSAILLPEDEITQKAETIIPDKRKTILVYCQTGVRSERAVRALLGMGYTNVYDLGGIVNWTGEIVWATSDTVFYNYFGNLPDDEVIPFTFTTTQRISWGVWLDFTIEGIIERSYLITIDKSRYYKSDCVSISTLTINNRDSRVSQAFFDLNTENSYASEDDMYGLSFDDWNFDGYLDVSLLRSPGGTMKNKPTYYWLWDNSAQEYIANDELNELSLESTVMAASELRQVIAFTRTGPIGYFTGYYEFNEIGHLVSVKTEELIPEPVEGEDYSYIGHYIVLELIGGEMITTEDYWDIKRKFDNY